MNPRPGETATVVELLDRFFAGQHSLTVEAPAAAAAEGGR